MTREPCTIVEIDMDFCALTYGQSPCTATLGGAMGQRKCFNGWATCQDKDNYDRGHLTLRFARPQSGLPRGSTIFPALSDVSETSTSVNIAGADDRLSAFGRRATVTVTLEDFTYHDRFVDKYQPERISGAAQLNGIGYDPAAFGTFWTKLKSRWPHYSSRPLRVIEGYLDGGIFTAEATRHYVITGIDGPTRGTVRVEAKDVLDLADNKRAVAPAPSSGRLAAAISAGDGALTLAPAGVGEEYPASGYAVIGSEIVTYTRVDDAITLTGRGQQRTVAASHSERDTFQEVFHVEDMRIDDLIKLLLASYAPVPLAFIPEAEWEAEITRWAQQIRVYADITKPLGVAQLVGEIAALGFSIWWDSANQKVGLKANRPVDGETVWQFSDANVYTMTQEDRDDDRLTEVLFRTVQVDPTKDLGDDNFLRGHYLVDTDAKMAESYGDSRLKTIKVRWFNQGADSEVRILSLRFLQRFQTAPKRIVLTVDARWKDIGLTDVVMLESADLADETGRPVQRPFQVIQISEPVPGHEIKLVLQAFNFAVSYAFITPNDYPVYSLATEEQKNAGAFIAPDGVVNFADGRPVYRMI